MLRYFRMILCKISETVIHSILSLSMCVSVSIRLSAIISQKRSPVWRQQMLDISILPIAVYVCAVRGLSKMKRRSHNPNILMCSAEIDLVCVLFFYTFGVSSFRVSPISTTNGALIANRCKPSTRMCPWVETKLFQAFVGIMTEINMVSTSIK